MRTRAIATSLSLALAGVASADHTHVTVDTLDGKIVIVAGYLNGEEEIDVDPDGWIRNGEEIFTIECDEIWDGDPFNGWPIAADQMTLTSDYYWVTGRLDGGYFWYELASVIPLQGDPDPTLIWAEEIGGTGLIRIADSDSDTRDKRSFELGERGHVHDQRQLIQNPGLYEVTIIAWDSNGVYQDSDPVRFLIEVPGCDADWNGDGSVNTQDFIAYLGDWASGDPRADLNGDGNVNTQDFIAFLNAWSSGC